MKYQKCDFGEKCKYFHPKGLKNFDQNKKNHIEKEHEVKNTYADVVKKSVQQQLQSSGPFLGQSQPVHQSTLGQVHHVQQPIIGQPNHTHQVFLEMQRYQKQMMDMVMNLNQKVNNMSNLQMQF